MKKQINEFIVIKSVYTYSKLLGNKVDIYLWLGQQTSHWSEKIFGNCYVYNYFTTKDSWESDFFNLRCEKVLSFSEVQ